MSSTSKTAKLQLNQWQRSDFVSMDDFNTDNSRIDAAMCALPFVRVYEKTLTSTANSMSINLSGLNITQYSRLFINFIGSGKSGFYLRCNNLTSGYAGLTQNGLRWLDVGYNTDKSYMEANYCDLLLTHPTTLYMLNCAAAYYTASIAPASLTSLLLWYQTTYDSSGVVQPLPAGTRCIIDGLKL